MGQRKQFTAGFKAKVALEAIKGQRMAQAAEIFTRGGVYDNETIEQEKAELYQQIGRLQMELDWLQKKSGILRR